MSNEYDKEVELGSLGEMRMVPAIPTAFLVFDAWLRKTRVRGAGKTQTGN
jgi:hypothetical protein